MENHSGKTIQIYLPDGDYIFNSPSAGAVVLLGRATNEWTSWKYKDGKTLDEVIRQK